MGIRRTSVTRTKSRSPKAPTASRTTGTSAPKRTSTKRTDAQRARDADLAASRAAVASVYERLDAWNSQSVTAFTGYPSQPPTGARELSDSERRSLNNMEANWGLSRR